MGKVEHVKVIFSAIVVKNFYDILPAFIIPKSCEIIYN